MGFHPGDLLSAAKSGKWKAPSGALRRLMRCPTNQKLFGLALTTTRLSDVFSNGVNADIEHDDKSGGKVKVKVVAERYSANKITFSLI